MTYKIIQADNIEQLIPAFKTYLNYMSRFYDIGNVPAWRDKAVKNLKKSIHGEDFLVYVIKNDRDIIGFAMVNRHLRFNTSGWAIAEFYIQKAYEKKGYGRRLANAVFSQSEENWEVAVTSENAPAMLFWQQVISSYTSGEYTQKETASINEHGFLFNRKTA